MVLAGKLRRPEPIGLTRARLERPLIDDPASRLDLVIAPPGSGKTTLLAHVSAAVDAAGIPVAWYQITAEDGAESALIGHLSQALHNCLGIDDGDRHVSGLLACLERWGGAAGLLVLDDLHEIIGTPAEHALEQFLLLRPPALRALVSSRRQPTMNLPRLRVSGGLREITSDALRFRSWEVEELFVSVFDEPLSPESAAALTRRTGGWAAGLQLFHLATAGRTRADRQQAVANLGARSKLIRSYLARNVLSELSDERRQFLLRTCTLGRLTGQLCDALLETTGSARVLDDLEQRQLFTSSADDGQTYRYHEVLRTHLELALIDEYGSAGARAWYARSAALLEEAGAQLDAARAYARAEDWGAVARLIQRARYGATGAAADILLPQDLLRHDPWPALAEARRKLRRGAVRAAVEAFGHAESLLDEPDFRSLCREERTLVMSWVGVY
ncbi:MAG: transcriptional regulator, partial [Geodermatophilaceae bacterium]|nr:transcriptional regulator [Geodermatophilaceae bacterium]